MKKENLEDITHCPNCGMTKEALFFYRRLICGKEQLVIKCRDCGWAELVE